MPPFLMPEEAERMRAADRRKPLPGIALPIGLLVALAGLPAGAQPIASGVGYLVASQAADGSWPSSQVRSESATTAALRALQAAAQAPGARSAGADFLESAVVADGDDRARRLVALGAEGRDVSALIDQLVLDVKPTGGWGLSSGFAASPLDSVLALVALAPGTSVADSVLQASLLQLLGEQRQDGGWPCVDGGRASDLYCTAHALLALEGYRARFVLDPEIAAATEFLRLGLNPDGSFGDGGRDRLVETTLASLALSAVPAFGAELETVVSFLEGQQQADGSWENDPYTTALALRALVELSQVPFCSDGIANRPDEACDGGDLTGLGCEDLGMGPGSLACSSQCTFDTTGCSAAPECGDDLRNQPFEVCDGSDLAAESCESMGFDSGTLGCSGDCLSFDVSACESVPSCNDGVINLPTESCDLSDLDGLTCEILGLGGGLLACASDCSLDTSGCDAATSEIDHQGWEFFIGFMPAVFRTNVSVLLTSSSPTSVTVQYPPVNPSYSQTLSVNPGAFTLISIPPGARASWPPGQVATNAVRLSGAEEFTVFQVNSRRFSTDVALALPVDALGTSLIVTTFSGSSAHSDDRSQFLVIAPFDDTTVTITPSAEMRWMGSTTPAGAPVEVVLNRGQGLRGEAVGSTADLTGTLIDSDRAVNLLNGNICTNVPTTTLSCDLVFETAHPVTTWGTSALLTNLPDRPGGSFYRVVASADGTDVALDGMLQTTLGKGGFLQLGPLPGRHVIEANQPVFVTQFMTGDGAPGADLGDPAMVNVIPSEQFTLGYAFSTISGIGNHFVTITAPDATIPSILLDGAPVDPAEFAPIGTTGFSSAVLPIAAGAHTTSSLEPHGITVEGIDIFDSYIYPGGARMQLINPICGDGIENQPFEECDGVDFDGATCAAFGFSSGFLQCTVGCTIDASQCSGLASNDEDGDGFPAAQDCDDLDAGVNPGTSELPGNGIDDDCNPATPDEVPGAAVDCRLSADRTSYAAIDVVLLEAVIDNVDELSTLQGLMASLVVTDSAGASIFDESREIAALPPGASLLQNFNFAAAGNLAGGYTAELVLIAGAAPLSVCSTSFSIDDSSDTGAGLIGSLDFDPEVVNAGETAYALYTLGNLGNGTLADLGIRVVVLNAAAGDVVGELLDSTSLEPGNSSSASQPFSTVDLPQGDYLGVLLGVLASGEELTLADDLLTVVNGAPDCSAAVAEPAELWPPNGEYVAIDIAGIVDPDGDPVSLTVTGVLQDESTNGPADGNTCPDATGVGSPQVRVRRERSGQGDGRVYHIQFAADDGRSGVCVGTATVCVPHEQGAGSTCIDQGALFDSGICP